MLPTASPWTTHPLAPTEPTLDPPYARRTVIYPEEHYGADYGGFIVIYVTAKASDRLIFRAPDGPRHLERRSPRDLIPDTRLYSRVRGR